MTMKIFLGRSALWLVAAFMLLLIHAPVGQAEEEEIQQIKKALDEKQEELDELQARLHLLEEKQAGEIEPRLSALEKKKAEPSNPVVSALEGRIGELEYALHGFTRLRFNLNANFDLNDAADRDDLIRFWDARAFLDFRVKWAPFTALLGVDLAGNDFNDGFIFGNDQDPLGPAGLREFDIVVKDLLLRYDGPLFVTVGRDQHHLGRGIVTHIRRDAIRLGKRFGPESPPELLLFSWVFGGEGITRIDPKDASPGVENSPEGDDENLDAFLLLANWRPLPRLRLQTFITGQIDSTQATSNPEKFFLDLNGDGTVGALEYGFEFAYLGGKTPGVGILAAPGGGRREYRAYLIYLDGGYRLPPNPPRLIKAGLTFGLGSGDKNPNDRKAENFENLFMDETGFHYTFLFSDDIHGFTGRALDLARGSGFANITFVKPYLVFQPLAKLTIVPSGTVLRSTKAQLEGTGPLGPGLGSLTFGPATSTRTTHDVGWEVDVLIDYKLSDNVSFFSYNGFFSPGDIFGRGADDAWKLEVGAVLKF